MLRDLAGTEKQVTKEVDLESRIRAEVVSKMAQKLMQLAGGDGEINLDLSSATASEPTASLDKANEV